MRFSHKIENCSLSPIRKFYPYQVACQKKGNRIIPLNIGQPDIKTPEAYKQAMREYKDDVLSYAPSPGIPVLIEAIQKYYKGIGLDFDTSDIIITTGGSEALSIAMNCVLDDGDEILVPEPLYPNYKTFIYLTGAKVVPIPTDPHNSYKYATRENLEKYVTPNTRAMLLTNPGNPTGNVLSPEERQIIADFVKDHDLFLMADEVYREFIYSDEPLASFGSIESIKDNLIILDSVSKRFSACGARIGTMISKNKELMAHAMKICQARLCVATIDQLAAAALYSVDYSYFNAVKEEYRLRRDTLYKGLKSIPGVEVQLPQGAFYMMATLPVDDTDKFQQWLLESFDDKGETVMYAPGAGFYSTPGAGVNEIRTAYVLSADRLTRACEVLDKAIKQYNKK